MLTESEVEKTDSLLRSVQVDWIEVVAVWEGNEKVEFKLSVFRKRKMAFKEGLGGFSSTRTCFTSLEDQFCATTFN